MFSDLPQWQVRKNLISDPGQAPLKGRKISLRGREVINGREKKIWIYFSDFLLSLHFW